MLEQIYPVIEKKLGAGHEFELFFERKVARSYESKDQALEAAKDAVQAGVSLRVFKDGRVAFTYSTDLSPAGLERLAQSALDILPFVDPDEACRLPETLPIAKHDLKDCDPGFGKVATQAKIEMAFALERAAKDFDPRVKYVRSASYEEEESFVEMRNSKGLQARHQKTDYTLVVMAVAESGDEAESAYEFDFGPYYARLDPEKVGRAAAKKAIRFLGGTTPQSAKLSVIFDPLVTAEILEVLSGSFQGDEVMKGKSFLANKLGETIYSPLLNLVDDSLLPGGVGSQPFDGEGQPGRTLALLEKGVLKNYLLDSMYGRKLHLTGNGSAVRKSFRKPPSVSYANFLLRPGQSSLNDLVRDAGSGILVVETIGMHAANPISGEFSVGAQGFLIEGGQIGRPVKKLTVAGNLHQMMADVKAVGNELRYYSNIGAPALLIDTLSISGT